MRRIQLSLARRQGASLIIVLVMLVVIGLTSAASLRNASSNERVSHNFRMHWLAEQYAEAALRYCQSQLLLADAQRVSSLQEAALLPINAGAPGWANPQTWSGSGGAFASLTSVAQSFIESSDSAFVPQRLPQCVVERQALPLLQNGVSVGSADVYVITARGRLRDHGAWFQPGLPGKSARRSKRSRGLAAVPSVCSTRCARRCRHPGRPGLDAHHQPARNMKPPVLQPSLYGRRYRLAGFSLVELLVVLVIMGVLSAVALPAYTRYVQRGHRTEAMAALLEAQHYMERYYSANGQYLSPSNAAPVLPHRLQQVPMQGSVRYRLSVREASVNSYLVQAVPEGSMAGDVCGSLTINQTGLRGVLNSTRSVAECWR